MSKYIKKVVYFAVVAIFLLAGNSVFAAGPFNTASNDCQTVSIGNVSSGAGIPAGGDGCGWFLSSVSAQAGQTINVHIYYHNASNTNATNTKIRLNQSTIGPASNFSFTGTVSSDQGSVSGNVNLSVSSSQTLTLSKVEWFPNQTGKYGNPTPLPGGQSGSALLSGGVDIGTITPEWRTQGELVAIFVVGNTVINPPVNTTCDITSFYEQYVYGSPTMSAVLSWTTNTANYVTLNGTTYQGPSGQATVYPYGNTTYTLVAYCNNGATNSRTINVRGSNGGNNDNRPTATTQTPRNIDEDSATLRGSINGNGSRIDGWFEMPCRSGDRYGQVYDVYDTDISYNRRGLQSDRRYEYCAVARNNNTGVTDYGAEVSFYTEDDDYNYNDDLDITTNNATNVSTTSARLNGYIDTNDSNTTRWFRYGTTTSSMYLTTNTTNHGSGGRSFSDYVYNLAPNTTYYYQAVASDRDGTHYDANIKSFNTNASIINNVSTSAVTTVATNVSTTGAQLNGLLLNTSGLSTSTYLEYGTTVNLGSRTTSKAVAQGTSIPFSDFVSGLAPNTIYFFRANAENGNGRVYGDIKIFKTTATTVVPPTTVIKTVTTRVGTDSPIMLKIENKYEIFRIGDIVDYIVTYENIGEETLTNPLLQVILPAHVQYRNSSRGTFAYDSNTLSVPLPDLKAKDGGVVYVQGQVVSLPENRSEIVTTALLAYTNPNGAQEDAMAYVLNHDDGMVITNNNLSANALFASGFLPGDLCGWLLIIIAILLMALLIRWLLGDRNRTNSQ